MLVFNEKIYLTCQSEVDFFFRLGKKWLKTNIVLGPVMMPGLSGSHLSPVEGQVDPQTI